jgi:hypothetical protein
MPKTIRTKHYLPHLAALAVAVPTFAQLRHDPNPLIPYTAAIVTASVSYFVTRDEIARYYKLLRKKQSKVKSK